MKIRYFVLATLLAATVAACSDLPTASKPNRTQTAAPRMDGDTATRSGGTIGSGH
jgi:hypothetical protein